MEACLVNLVEPGNKVVVAVNRVFGTRMCDIVNRIGGKLVKVDGEWGRAVDSEAVAKAVKGCKPKVVAVVHAETSTGACTPLEDISKIAHGAGALFLVDCVTSLAGIDVPVDRMNIDAAYSGILPEVHLLPAGAFSRSPSAPTLSRPSSSASIPWSVGISISA